MKHVGAATGSSGNVLPLLLRVLLAVTCAAQLVTAADIISSSKIESCIADGSQVGFGRLPWLVGSPQQPWQHVVVRCCVRAPRHALAHQLRTTAVLAISISNSTHMHMCLRLPACTQLACSAQTRHTRNTTPQHRSCTPIHQPSSRPPHIDN